MKTADAGRWCTRTERSLESLFGDRELYANGSLLAVDATGVLRGVVTTEQLRVRYDAAVPQDPAWRRAAGLERRWPIGRRPGWLSRRREAGQPEEVPAAKPRKIEA